MNKSINRNYKTLVLAMIIGIGILWIGCSQTSTENGTTNTTAPQNLSLSTTVVPHHEHKPPHHGTLVVLGKEFSHVEMVLDPDIGKLTGYALDGEAENPVKLSQKEIKLQITLEQTPSKSSKKTSFQLLLTAVPNVLTGEIMGNTSEFAGQSDSLKGIKEFDAVLYSINIRGSEFKNVAFNFPKGNDTD